MPKYRKLITGKRVREAPEPVKWTFKSKCPAKWLHIDCEFGNVYVQGSTWQSWRDPSLTLIKAGIKALKDWLGNTEDF